MKTILLMDDCVEILEILGEWLMDEGYTVIPACDGIDGTVMIKNVEPDLIITDIELPRMSGPEFYKGLAKKVPIIFMSGNPLLSENIDIDEKNHWVVSKPFDYSVLRNIIAKAVDPSTSQGQDCKIARGDLFIEEFE